MFCIVLMMWISICQIAVQSSVRVLGMKMSVIYSRFSIEGKSETASLWSICTATVACDVILHVALRVGVCT